MLVKVTTRYFDRELQRICEIGEQIEMPTERAKHVISIGYVEAVKKTPKKDKTA